MKDESERFSGSSFILCPFHFDQQERPEKPRREKQARGRTGGEPVKETGQRAIHIQAPGPRDRADDGAGESTQERPRQSLGKELQPLPEESAEDAAKNRPH